MKQKNTILMTEGNIVKTLIMFILPLIGSSLFQQLYNTADFLFVGNLLRKSSAAAVGASSTLITCIIGLFSGVSVGTGVVVSQAVGNRDNSKANQALHSSIAFGLVGGFILMVGGILASPFILRIINTPESVVPEAVLYMRIYLLSLPMLICYNMCSAALRACGDSQTPFRILIVCGFVNVAADAFFMIVIPLGVIGVAVATSVSQGLSAFLAFLALAKEGHPIQLSTKIKHIDWDIMKDVLKIGLPSGVQSIIITFSNVMVQYYINGFGDTAVAAFATYYKVENIIWLPIMAFGQAMTTFAGQNAGAKQFKRIRKGCIITTVMGAVVTFCIAGLILLFPHTVFGWFMKNQDVVTDAITIAGVSFIFYWIYPLLEVPGAALRGMGYSIRAMIITIVNMCVLRVSLLAIFSEKFRTLKMIASVYPITWATSAVCFIVMFAIVIRKKCKLCPEV